MHHHKPAGCRLVDASEISRSKFARATRSSDFFCQKLAKLKLSLDPVPRKALRRILVLPLRERADDLMDGWQGGLLGLIVTSLFTWLALFFFTVRPAIATPHWHAPGSARPSLMVRRSDSTSSVSTVHSIDVSRYTLVESRPLLQPLRPALRGEGAASTGKRVRLASPEDERPVVPSRTSSAERAVQVDDISELETALSLEPVVNAVVPVRSSSVR